ncbi:hypothetical protein ACJ41O_007656 [Fusarium nematophilum]
MFKKKRAAAAIDEEQPSGYELDWEKGQRWNPHYVVPRNSVDFDHADSAASFNSRLDEEARPRRHGGLHHTTRSFSYARNKRDMDTRAIGIRRGIPEEELGEEEDFSPLKLWIETVSELYMNELDNRARWDPRWLNVTRRERFEGLASVSVSVVDYSDDDTVQRSKLIRTKKELAATLEERPPGSQVRVVMVSDLSRFAMGALGHLYSVDPEFWFEHLIASGYSASDSGLKLKNAVWMNWQGREARFRHRPLPGIGQRTEWNLPRRAKRRTWAHLRWARLGLLHYLGRKGFHEDEIECRISDGRWTIERDVVLDKNGLLMTEKRKETAEERTKKKKAREKKNMQQGLGLPQVPTEPEIEGTSTRSKSTNVYRPYSTFHPVLPSNPFWWRNRDLRVLAPEGIGYWSNVDEEGRKTIILLFDPPRSMKHDKTNEVTPSLTFMPRAMEFESYTDDELWRTADPDETYLDPPPPLPSKKELKAEKRAARNQRHKDKKEKLNEKLKADKDGPNTQRPKQDEQGYETDSTYHSDSEYDEEYEKALRDEYKSPQPYIRDRYFAQKYAMSTFDLVYRYISTLRTSELRQDESLIPDVLTRLSSDDTWQLVAELRMMIDHIDADLSGHLHEAIWALRRQHLGWIRSAVQELSEWTGHIKSSTGLRSRCPELSEELDELISDLRSLQTRCEQTLNLVIASTTVAQSTTVIDQTSGINKLTELAFFFIPLSFITSVFSMQVAELTETPPKLWTWGLSLTLVFTVTYLIRSTLRSPTMQSLSMRARMTMLNRFTPSKHRPASGRVTRVGNRAIVKFWFFFISAMSIILLAAVTFLLILFLLYFGIWIGAAVAALYFIITRWPDPAVLVPCFISLALVAGGATVTWRWYDIINSLIQSSFLRVTLGIKALFPSSWWLDKVEDEDLAREGLEINGRQPFMLAG